MNHVARRGQRFEQSYDANDWLRILMELGVGGLTSSQWAPAFASEIQPARFSAGMADLRPFVATFLHETAMLKQMSENMNYSAPRICEVWPSRFKSEADAGPYARNPKALANKVYGNRMGNGDEASGDGYNYRGRASGITGRTNYLWLADKWGQDLESNPALLERPHFAAEASFYAWEGLMPDKHLSDQVKVRRIYNGGVIGLEHCQALYELGCKVMA